MNRRTRRDVLTLTIGPAGGIKSSIQLSKFKK